MRAAEAHLYAIIVLPRCHLDEAQWASFPVVPQTQPTGGHLWETDLSLDLGDADATVSPSLADETTRAFCSPAI